MISRAGIAFADRRLWAFMIGVAAVTVGVLLLAIAVTLLGLAGVLWLAMSRP